MADPHILANLLEHGIRHYICRNFRTFLARIRAARHAALGGAETIHCCIRSTKLAVLYLTCKNLTSDRSRARSRASSSFKLEKHAGYYRRWIGKRLFSCGSADILASMRWPKEKGKTILPARQHRCLSSYVLWAVILTVTRSLLFVSCGRRFCYSGVRTSQRRAET